MANWKELKIYKGSVWWKPRNKDGVITKKGSFQHFEWCHIAYCLAARELLEGPSVVKVALPIAYMQRHSLELAIKAITSMAYEIARLRDELTSLDSDTQETTIEKEPKYGHRFGEALEEANHSLAAIGEGKVPEEFGQLAGEFDGFDGGHPDRMRYDRFKPKRNEGSKGSFEGKVEVDLRKRQEALERLLETHLFWDPMNMDKADSFYARLAQKMWETSQDIALNR